VGWGLVFRFRGGNSLVAHQAAPAIRSENCGVRSWVAAGNVFEAPPHQFGDMLCTKSGFEKFAIGAPLSRHGPKKLVASQAHDEPLAAVGVAKLRSGFVVYPVARGRVNHNNNSRRPAKLKGGPWDQSKR